MASPPPSLTYLLDEMLEKIILFASANHFQDTCSAKMTCTTINRLGKDDRFLKAVPFFHNGVPVLVTPGSLADQDPIVALRRACLRVGNADALFMRGIASFMYEDNPEIYDSGVRDIKRAAHEGCSYAKYAYEILQKELFPPDLDVMGIIDGSVPFLTRQEAQQIRSRLDGMERTGNHWGLLWLSPHVTRVRDEIGFDFLRGCPCDLVNGWVEMWDPMAKGPRMCEDCFWKLEAHGFCELFPKKFGSWPY